MTVTVWVIRNGDLFLNELRTWSGLARAMLHLTQGHAEANLYTLLSVRSKAQRKKDGFEGVQVSCFEMKLVADCPPVNVYGPEYKRLGDK